MADLTGIAVVGMAGRFPAANNIAEFWRNIRSGRDCITFYNDRELIAAGIDPAVLENPGYVKAKGEVADVDMFAASFFGINPREAEVTDPQHRLLLECAWEAMEHAGYDSSKYDGPIGIYGGKSMDYYLLLNVYPRIKKEISAGSLQAAIGNDADSLTTTISYRLNLKGPGITIQTSSSTSLVAVCLACQSLLTYQCDMALAGGISAGLPLRCGYLYREGNIRASSGSSRASAARAQGIVPGCGMGLVVLKRLEDAAADRDHIWAVIKGFAVNNDGAEKANYSAHSAAALAEVIAEAQAAAAVHPESIQYIETHGTGTNPGDADEITALTRTFRLHTKKKQFCAIGSLKFNIGHLENAAGVTGLMKATLAIKYRLIPPSLQFREPHPEIDFADSPFFVNTALREWQAEGKPRRAGVTSLGRGGTNAHVILEEYPRPPAPVETGRAAREYKLFLLSARTETALNRMTENLLDYLKKNRSPENPDFSLDNAAYTLACGRRDFNHRRAVLCRCLEEAETLLSQLTPGQVFAAVCDSIDRPVVFIFPGQGWQYINMAKGLYFEEPVFKENMDRCAQFLTPILGLDPRELIYPGKKDNIARNAEKLKLPPITQPVLFMVEYSLARIWLDWGIKPAALIGSSSGEYAAACTAGCLSREDALNLAALRGRFMHEQEKEKDAKTEPIIDEFAAVVGKVKLNPPEIPLISSLTGTWIKAEEATDPRYWVSNLRRADRFSAGLREILTDPGRVLLEIGPAENSLSGAAAVFFSSLGRSEQQEPDTLFLLKTLAGLWGNGVAIDWNKYYKNGRPQRIPLPTYPFERRRYWLAEIKDSTPAAVLRPAEEEVTPEAGAVKEEVKEQKETAVKTFQPRPVLPNEYEAPADEVEEKFVKTWEDILGIQPIGIGDNFFDLGGDSLTGIALLSRIQKELEIRLPLSELFETPTIKELTGAVRGKEKRKYSAIPAAEEKEYYSLSSAQEGLYIMNNMEPGAIIYTIQRAMLLAGDLDRENLEHIFKKLIRHHESLRTSFHLIDSQPAQRIHRPGEVELKIEYYEVDGTAAKSAATLSSMEREFVSRNKAFLRPFDLSQPPLFRVGLIKIPHEPGTAHILVLNMHHLIYDGISMGILLREFIMLYRDHCIPLPRLRLQYRDFAEWQRSSSKSEFMQRQQAFWLDKFSPGITLPDLPVENTGAAGTGSIDFELGVSETGKLRELAIEEGVSLFMLQMAVFFLLLSKLCSRQDIVVGTSAAGRTHPDLANIIGIFVNMLALRVRLEPEQQFHSFLMDVKSCMLTAYENQGYRYEELVQQLLPGMEPGRRALFNAAFISQDMERKAGELAGIEAPGLKLIPAEMVVEAVKLPYEIILFSRETASKLLVSLSYKKEHFKKETVMLLVENFKSITAAIMENSHIRLGDITISHGLLAVEPGAAAPDQGDFAF